MTWDAHHGRDAVLREAMAVAETRRDGLLPWSEIAGAEEAFGTPADLLGALQMRWHTRLSGAIERELTEQPWDLQQAVVHAWRGLSADMPGVRAILDAHAEEDAMRRARRKEWALLASACGLTAMDDAAAPRIGEQIEARARSVSVVKDHAPTGAGRRRRIPRVGTSWLGRRRHTTAA